MSKKTLITLFLLLFFAGCKYAKPSGLDFQISPKENTKHKYGIIFIFDVMPSQYKDDKESDDIILLRYKQEQINCWKEDLER